MANNWCTYNGKVIFFNGKSISSSSGSLIPKNTLRFKFSNTSYVPTIGYPACTATIGSWSAYDASAGIWDWTCDSTDWYAAFQSGFTARVIGAGNTVELIAGSSNITATSMEAMFHGCTSLKSVPLFDTSSVKNMGDMFLTCEALTSVPLFDTSSVKRMSNMFAGCKSLTSVPLFDTSSVVYMQSMFLSCSSLKSVPLFDTSSVLYMSNMFGECTSLKSVPLFNTSSAKSMVSMFYGCSSLKSVPLLDTSSVTNMESMFQYCRNVESGALALYQQASSQATPPSSHAYCFRDCGLDTTTGAAELAQIPSDWK